MVRNYKRIIDRQSWSEEPMARAIRLVKSGETIFQEAVETGDMFLKVFWSEE